MSQDIGKVTKVDGEWRVDGRPRESVKFVKEYHPSNIPGKTVVIMIITCGPDGATPPHRHGHSSLWGLPIEGTTIEQMEGHEPFEAGPGEPWHEGPGCHHVRSENPSKEKTASFYALFIVDDQEIQGGMEPLFVLDADREELPN